MGEIWTMGEILVEIMRPTVGVPLGTTGEFIGPFPSGAPAIFIDTVAKLGHKAGIIGGVGQDEFGKHCLERLRQDGVDCSRVSVVSHGFTAVAFVAYFADGSRRFIYHIDGTPAVNVDISTLDTFENPAFFHLMGCSLMINDAFRQTIYKTADVFYQKGAKISFDPNIRPELLGTKDIEEVINPILEKCAVLMPGVDELKLVTGQNTIETAVQAAFENPVLQMITLKRGKHGSTIYTRDTEIHIPAYVIKEADPTGAGDCFDAGLLCGLLENKSLLECGQMAAAAGALNAAAFGPMEGNISSKTVKKLITSP